MKPGAPIIPPLSFAGIEVRQHPLIPPGFMVVWQGNQVVRIVKLDDDRMELKSDGEQ